MAHKFNNTYLFFCFFYFFSSLVSDLFFSAVHSMSTNWVARLSVVWKLILIWIDFYTYIYICTLCGYVYDFLDLKKINNVSAKFNDTFIVKFYLRSHIKLYRIDECIEVRYRLCYYTYIIFFDYNLFSSGGANI